MTLHEAQAYYEDFEVQTLYYRAPEVVLGVKLNQQIDMVRPRGAAEDASCGDETR
jgi:hypothetical protein